MTGRCSSREIGQIWDADIVVSIKVFSFREICPLYIDNELWKVVLKIKTADSHHGWCQKYFEGEGEEEGAKCI